jgi:flagellar biogenesis protein FliO
MCTSKSLIVAACSSLLFSRAVCLAADVLPSVYPTTTSNNAPAAQSSFAQPATHTQSEPRHFEPASSIGTLALPAPPPSESGGSSSGPRALGAIASVVGSLIIVLGLFFALAWFMRRGMPNSSRLLSSDVVQVLGRTPLAGRQQMHVLRFGNKLLLVCASASGVDTLAEVTDPLEIDRVAGLCAQTESYSATTTFKQIFGQLAREKAPDLPASKLARASRRGEEATDA